MQSTSWAVRPAPLSAISLASTARSVTVSDESMEPSSPVAKTDFMKASLSGAAASCWSMR